LQGLNANSSLIAGMNANSSLIGVENGQGMSPVIMGGGTGDVIKYADPYQSSFVEPMV